MYASANSMVRTANGALVIGGRFPLMSLQVSWDDGHSWAFYSLESRPGGNGAMVEVAPNVVMCTAPIQAMTSACLFFVVLLAR